LASPLAKAIENNGIKPIKAMSILFMVFNLALKNQQAK
jgi:hypothetical protein